MNRLKHNLISMGFYGVGIALILWVCIGTWYRVFIPIAALSSIFLGILNDILAQLRMLNGAEFPYLDEGDIDRPPKPKDFAIRGDYLTNTDEYVQLGNNRYYHRETFRKALVEWEKEYNKKHKDE